MTDQPTFGERLRELRKAAGYSAQELGLRLLGAGVWRDMTPTAARTRITGLELGRLANPTREECAHLEALLGAPAGELWSLALKDDRRVEREAREHYEASLRELDSMIVRLLAAKEDLEATHGTLDALWREYRDMEMLAESSPNPDDYLPELESIMLKIREIEAHVKPAQEYYDRAAAEASAARERVLHGRKAIARARMAEEKVVMDMVNRARELPDDTPNPVRSLARLLSDSTSVGEDRDLADMLHLLATSHTDDRRMLISTFLAIMVGQHFLDASTLLGERPSLSVEKLRARVHRQRAESGAHQEEGDEPPL